MGLLDDLYYSVYDQYSIIFLKETVIAPVRGNPTSETSARICYVRSREKQPDFFFIISISDSGLAAI
jgi:hypothetical protein